MSNTVIKFGTSGWRAVIAEEFTLNNLKRAAHAAARHARDNKDYGFKGDEYRLNLKNGKAKAPSAPLAVIGCDTRYMSEEFARNAAEVFAAEGVNVLFSPGETPTPVVAWTVMRSGAVGGVMITASHNPANYNGFKWTPYWGGPAIPEVTNDIEARASALTIADCDKFIPYAQAKSAGLVKEEDFHHSYFAQLYSLLDAGALKKARLKVAADSVYGTARTYLRPALEKMGASVTPLREHRDVTFGGRPPDTDAENLAGLRQAVLKGKLALGLACDGDGDRFGVIDSDGTWIAPNDVLALLLDHLVRNRGMKGKVARSVMTSHFADAVARSHGLEVRETPVGFKYVGNMLRTGQFLIGGEESGGLSIMNHVPEKDGILACMLLAELYACERKPLGKVLAGLRKRVGTFLNTRVNLRLGPDADVQALAAKLNSGPPLNLGGSSVWRIDHTDGFKFIMRDGSWLGLRPSGTEPVVRIYAEASSRDKLDKLVDAGKKIADGKF